MEEAARKAYIEPMKRRTFLTALAALAAASPAIGQDQLLAEVSKYLDQLRSIKGRFTQVNADGSRATGSYYLRRPGLIRFEYDGGQAMIIADGVNVGVLDAKSNAGAQKFPLNATPLRFLLRDKIDLTTANLARSAASRGNSTSVVLQDPKAPRDGSMTLNFSNKPPRLLEWITTERTGQKTKVVLDTLEQSESLRRSFFSIEAEARKMGIDG